jgi:uncharacterized membrane protein YphA (DoxX/SURF4 family)
VGLVTKLVVASSIFARLAVGLTFSTAGAAKVSDDARFRLFVATLPGMGGNIGRLTGRLLPFAEVAVGCFLFVGFHVRSTGLLAAALLVAFTLGIIVSLRRGVELSCGCFGRLDQKPISLQTVARNLLLIGASLVIVFGAAEYLGVDAWTPPAGIRISDVVALLSVELALFLSIVVGYKGFELRSNGLEPPSLPAVGALGPAWYGFPGGAQDAGWAWRRPERVKRRDTDDSR